VSFEAIFEAFKRTKEHIERQQTKAPYEFVAERLEGTRELLIMWLNIYELYANGYRREVATWSKPDLIRNLSICGRGLEKKLVSYFQTKIPFEVYVLLDSFFNELKRTEFYIVAEADGFEQKSIYDEIYGQSLRNVSAPRTVELSRNEQLMKEIMKRDMAILYYEQGQHDNALSWPLLLHEALHWLYKSEGLASLEKKVDKKPSWINEVLIDIYIPNIFGPAYATSLVSYLSRYPHEETLSHPHFIARLYTCFRYLSELVKSKKLPSPLDTEAQEAMKYVEEFQGRYEDTLEEIKKQLDHIYEKTHDAIIENVARKTKPFVSFVQEMANNKKQTEYLSPKDFPKKEVFLTEDVQRYYDLGIPIAAHPKILFNSFISKKYLDREVNTLFIQESLKKYYVRQKWSEVT